MAEALLRHRLGEQPGIDVASGAFRQRPRRQMLGPVEATVLMEHLPPVGWADVAAKRDLDVLESRFDMSIDRVDARLDEMDRRLESLDGLPHEFRSQLYALMSFMAVMVGAMVAAIKI